MLTSPMKERPSEPTEQTEKVYFVSYCLGSEDITLKSSAIWKKHSSIIDLVDKVSQKSQI